MSEYEPGRVYADEVGYYASAEGGEPLTCSACGQRLALEDVFTTDGVTTLHALPQCDPDWQGVEAVTLYEAQKRLTEAWHRLLRTVANTLLRRS